MSDQLYAAWDAACNRVREQDAEIAALKALIALLEAHVTTDNSTVIATLEARIALLEDAIEGAIHSYETTGNVDVSELRALLQEQGE